MSVKAIEDELNIAKVITIQLLQARTAGKSLADVLQSPELKAAVALAVPEIADAAAEALDLSILDDIELAEYIFGTVTDIVRAVKTAKAS